MVSSVLFKKFETFVEENNNNKVVASLVQNVKINCYSSLKPCRQSFTNKTYDRQIINQFRPNIYEKQIDYYHLKYFIGLCF